MRYLYILSLCCCASYAQANEQSPLSFNQTLLKHKLHNEITDIQQRTTASYAGQLSQSDIQRMQDLIMKKIQRSQHDIASNFTQ